MTLGRFGERASARPISNFASAYFSYDPCDSMGSGARLVKMRESSAIARWRCCLAHSDVISSIAAVQLARTARRKKRWIKNLPGIDMRITLGAESSAILILIELRSAVLYPASSKIAFTISQTDDFRFVPVTATTKRLFVGNPY